MQGQVAVKTLKYEILKNYTLVNAQTLVVAH